MTAQLRGVWQVNQALVGCIQTHQPATSATLDMDATLVETHKRNALHCYKGFKAYQIIGAKPWAAPSSQAGRKRPRT